MKGKIVFWSILSLLLGVGALFVWIGMSTSFYYWYTPTVGVVVVLLTFFFWGLKTVPPEQRWVIELLGEYYGELKPGLNWVCPLLAKVRAVVSTWAQSIPLFNEEGIQLDFLDGYAKPKGVRAIVRVKQPDKPYRAAVEPAEAEEKTGTYRCIYVVDDWRGEVKELLETATRSYLGTITVDGAQEEQQAGFNLLMNNRMPDAEITQLRNTLEQWGLALERLAITDFDWPSEITKARAAVQQRRRAVQVAELEKQVRAQETVGALINMLAEATGDTPDVVKQKILSDPETNQRMRGFCEELVTRQMSLDAKALTDVRVTGTGGDLEQAIARILTLAKSTLAGQ